MTIPCPIRAFLLNTLHDDPLRGKFFCAKNGDECCAILLMGYLALQCDDPSGLVDDLRKAFSTTRLTPSAPTPDTASSTASSHVP